MTRNAAVRLLAVAALAATAAALRSVRPMVNGVALQSENDCGADAIRDVDGSTVHYARGTPVANGPVPDDGALFALLADMGDSQHASAQGVLSLIRSEGADAVVFAGGVDGKAEQFHTDVSHALSPSTPVFAALSPDAAGEDDILQLGLFSNRAGTCEGIHGARQVCTHAGVTVVTVSPAVLGCGHARFVRESFAKYPSTWRVCAFYETQESMQVGDNADATGWDVYEACREAGAMVVTGRNKAYARSHELSSTPRRTVVSTDTSRPVELTDTMTDREGTTVVAVVGTGGDRIDTFDDVFNSDRPHWAVSLSEDSPEPLQHGALFCRFGAGGHERRGSCYFKQVNGMERDAFTVFSRVGIADSELEVRRQVASVRDNAVQRVGAAECFFGGGSDAVTVGTTATGEAVTTAFRFVEFPLDAATLAALDTEVEEAYLVVQPLGTAPSDGNLTVRAVASDGAAEEAACGHDVATNRTDASVEWPAWTHDDLAAGGTVRSPDLKAVLAEVMARPGWNANQAVTLTLGGLVHREVAGFGAAGGCCQAPQLVVRLRSHLHVSGTALDDSGAVQVNCAVPGECTCDAAASAGSLYVDGAPSADGPRARAPAANYTVAFLGNGGVGDHSQEVLEKVAAAGASLVVHAGGLLNGHSPAEWLAQLGAAGIDGAHHLWVPNANDVANSDDKTLASLAGELKPSLDALGTCEGHVGANAVCTRPGMTFALVSPGVAGCDHAEFVRHAFAEHPAMWRVCVLPVASSEYDAGSGVSGAADTDAVYDACRRAGALVVAGGSHTYARTFTMAQFSPARAVTTNADAALVLSEEVLGTSDETSKDGTSAALHVGMGGTSRGSLTGVGPFFAKAQGSGEGAQEGAVVCTFNYAGMEDLARCERVQRTHEPSDEFWLRTTAGELPLDWQVRVQVRSGTDDFEEAVLNGTSAPAFSCGSSDIEVVDDPNPISGTVERVVGLRFAGFPLSQLVLDELRTGITGAWLQFRANVDDAGGNDFAVTIHGDRNWNVEQKCDEDVRLRDWTDQVTTWEDEARWNLSSVAHRTPDLSLVVADMIDTTGFVAGGAAAFYLIGHGTRRADSFEQTCCNAPEIVIQLGPHNVDFSKHGPILSYNATGFDPDFPDGNSGGGDGSGDPIGGDGDESDGDEADGDEVDGDGSDGGGDGSDGGGDGGGDGDESDGDEVDGDESDGDESDGDESDGDESDGDESDGDESDGDESDGDESDGDESDGDESDGDESDGDESDGDESDGDESDGDESDGDEADGDESDGDESDGDESDGDESDGDGSGGDGTTDPDADADADGSGTTDPDADNDTDGSTGETTGARSASGGGVSGGAVAGILVALLVVGLVAFFVWRKRRQQKSHGFESAGMTTRDSEPELVEEGYGEDERGAFVRGGGAATMDPVGLEEEDDFGRDDAAIGIGRDPLSESSDDDSSSEEEEESVSSSEEDVDLPHV